MDAADDANFPDARIIAMFGPVPEGMDLTEDEARSSSIALIVVMAMAMVSVCLRHLARYVQGAGLKADDYLITVGLVSFLFCLSVLRRDWRETTLANYCGFC